MKNWWQGLSTRWRVIWGAAAVVVVLALIGSLAGGDDEPDTPFSDEEAQALIDEATRDDPPDVPAAVDEPDPEPEPTVAPEPDADVSSRCDYLLGDFSESATGYRFVADADVENTGNVGVVVRVTAQWDQIGTGAVKSTKTLRVPRGATRTAQFTVTARQDQIDLHQSADAECRVVGRIVNTFGEAG